MLPIHITFVKYYVWWSLCKYYTFFIIEFLTSFDKIQRQEIMSREGLFEQNPSLQLHMILNLQW